MAGGVNQSTLLDADRQRIPPEIRSSEDLRTAFDLFSEVSTQLSDSYKALEHKVVELSAERDQADRQRLRELEEKERISERLQSLLDLLPGGVIVLDARGMVCDNNPAAVDILGQPVAGKRWIDVIAECLAPRADDGHEVSLRDGRRLSLATRSLQGGCGQVILLTDQTETRRLQAQVARQERLTLMGRMLAALAHQIRTPLAAAMLYAGHLTASDLDVNKVQIFARKVLSRLEAMEKQVRDMLTFVRDELRLDSVVTVAALLESVRSALEPELTRTQCVCDWHVTAAPATSLLCNQDALVGAVMNLINNALQAMESHGELRIEVKEDGGGDLSLSVIDNGPGMDELTIRKVQEAFFTTKSHGTGLGLAVVRSVVRSHGGRFELRSEPGTGTNASITLPVARPATERADDG